MGITVYGRKAIRRFERETCQRIVHAVGWPTPLITTTQHGHYQRIAPGYWRMELWGSPTTCGLGLSSCRVMFGLDQAGVPRWFMRGACDVCGVGPYLPHYYDCPVLLRLLADPAINPDYYPRPVHLPLWWAAPK